jgi:uncharacterized protein GlcG (DUF336 family)
MAIRDLIRRIDALKIAGPAIASCERHGETAAAFVTDADGHLRAALSSDGLNPIGLGTASLKTASVLQGVDACSAGTPEIQPGLCLPVRQ